MLSFEKNFAPRADGRCATSLACCLARLRALAPALSYARSGDTPDSFKDWQCAVRKRFAELLRMPEKDSAQPAPRKIASAPRDGYTLETWELYPDRWSAVPFYLLRPEGVTMPRPAVICVPGSHHAKEVLAGEPMPDNPNCVNVRFPERNMQAKHMVKAGYIALAFDNPGTAGLTEIDSEGKETQWENREKLVQAYTDMGTTYLGVSVFQKMLALDWLMTLPEVDKERIAVAGHSLGSEVALALGVLDPRIRAVVFNDFVCDERVRYTSITELQNNELDDGGNWHQVPGIWAEFGFQDLLAAIAPKPLVINEGGAEQFLDVVRAGYRRLNASDKLAIHYYPCAEALPKVHSPIPDHGLTLKEFYEKYNSVYAEDHSFRAEHSLEFLKKTFEMSQK